MNKAVDIQVFDQNDLSGHLVSSVVPSGKDVQFVLWAATNRTRLTGKLTRKAQTVYDLLMAGF